MEAAAPGAGVARATRRSRAATGRRRAAAFESALARRGVARGARRARPRAVVAARVGAGGRPPGARVLGLPPRRASCPGGADRALALARVRARVGQRGGRERLARARRAAARRRRPRAERGWLDLARSERTREPVASARLAASAVDVASETRDVDLELRALAQLGLAEVSAGEIEDGLARLDEAMAAATGGEAATLETFADVSCTLMLACERAGDGERPRQWAQVFETFARRYDHVALLAFCRSCCADVHRRAGASTRPSVSSLEALRELEAAGQRARCVQPATRLAEIRVLQGRFEEAEQYLRASRTSRRRSRRPSTSAWPAASPPRRARSWSSSLDRPRALEPARRAAARAPRRGEDRGRRPRRARARRRRARGDRRARPAATAREALAALSRRAAMAAASGDPRAPELLQRALNLFAALPQPLEAARVRLELARARATAAPQVAIDLARRARSDLEALGAVREADEAAALLRALGAKGRTGPRDHGLLSKRECEVLRLLGEGLRNAEIARGSSSARRPPSITSVASTGSCGCGRGRSSRRTPCATRGANRGAPPTRPAATAQLRPERRPEEDCHVRGEQGARPALLRRRPERTEPRRRRGLLRGRAHRRARAGAAASRTSGRSRTST